MARPPKFVDELHALKVLSLYRRAKRKNPEVTLDDFFTDLDMRELKRYFAPMLELLRERYGFEFVRLCRKKSGRTDIVAEADPVLDRFDAAFDRFLADDWRREPDRPARIGAWGAVLDACLAPALSGLPGGSPAPTARGSDLVSFSRGMRKVIGFHVDAALALYDSDEKRAAFTNLVEFHPSAAEVRLMVVSGVSGDETRVFAAGLPGQWDRVAPRPVPTRGDIVAASPYTALELAKSGFGAAVVVGLPLVLKRARELGLRAAALEAAPPLRLGLFTRYPRERMLASETWAKVRQVLAWCAAQ